MKQAEKVDWIGVTDNRGKTELHHGLLTTFDLKMLYHHERKMCINSEEIISNCLIVIVVFAIHLITHNFETYYTPSPHPYSVRL